jgi:hypothetical protein
VGRRKTQTLLGPLSTDAAALQAGDMSAFFETLSQLAQFDPWVVDPIAYGEWAMAHPHDHMAIKKMLGGLAGMTTDRKRVDVSVESMVPEMSDAELRHHVLQSYIADGRQFLYPRRAYTRISLLQDINPVAEGELVLARWAGGPLPEGWFPSEDPPPKRVKASPPMIEAHPETPRRKPITTTYRR